MRPVPTSRRHSLFSAAMLAALVAAGPSFAFAPLVAPKAIISGPTTASPGDLTVLDASGSTSASGFAWVLADSDKSFLEVEDGRKLVFASGTPGKYTFVLVAANADAAGKPAVALARHVLTIGPPGPGPNPVPPVPPGPDPLPPGRYDLSRFARDHAAAVQLDSGSKARTAAAMANNFDSVASTIAAGAINDPAAIITATQAGNINALGAHRTAWQPWGEQLRQRLNVLSEATQLVSGDDYATAWREISLGLRAVQ